MTNPRCQCSDRGCPGHPGISFCIRNATATLFRVDMEDETGTPFCPVCAAGAMASGLFTDETEDAQE
jgi:hypothetical protein